MEDVDLEALKHLMADMPTLVQMTGPTVPAPGIPMMGPADNTLVAEPPPAPTEAFVTAPTEPAYENMPPQFLLGNDYQRFDYRLGMLESAQAQDQHRSGRDWQPYALVAAGGLCIVVAALAVKGHVSNQVMVGGMFVAGFFLLFMAVCCLPSAQGPAQANA